MGRVYVLRKQDESFIPNTLQTQAVVGGPQGGLLISPERPISPQEAGMQAAMGVLGDRQLPQQTQQAVQQGATTAASRANRAALIASLLGSAGKTIYDASLQGQAPSLTGMASSAYGAQQFLRPLATRYGAQYGAQRAFRNLGSPQGTRQATMDEFFPAQVEGGQTIASPTPAPPMTADNTRQSSLSEFTPQPKASEDMAGALQNVLPDPAKQAKELEEKQEEQREKQKEMKEEEQRKLNEELRDKMNDQSTGA